MNGVVNIEDLRKLAKKRLPKIAYDFIEGGTDDEVLDQLWVGRPGRSGLSEDGQAGQAEPHSQQSEGTHFHPACSLR